MSTSVLIVEDDKFKVDDLKKEIANDWEVTIVASVRDAVVKVLDEVFDGIILDMALPTFTADSSSLSGTAQPQGGVEVLRALKSTQLGTPVVIVSQYPDLEIDGVFHSLDAAPKVLSERYGIDVVGAVVYDFQDRGWSDEFRRMLNRLQG